jgi:4-hydroxy-3-polyprenylbenzoate decarboxylase
MVLIIAITGATGVVFGVRLLEVLSSMKGIDTHLIISKNGEMVIKEEMQLNLRDVRKLASVCHNCDDLSAPIASGSFRHDGMIIVPCTMKTMSGLANSYTDNLILRAGDVAMKEQRKLVLAVRETPLHLGHLRNMEKLAEMGARIMPPMPAFYSKPQSIQDLIDQFVGKLLDVFDIKHDLYRRWEKP